MSEENEYREAARKRDAAIVAAWDVYENACREAMKVRMAAVEEAERAFREAEQAIYDKHHPRQF